MPMETIVILIWILVALALECRLDLCARPYWYVTQCDQENKNHSKKFDGVGGFFLFACFQVLLCQFLKNKDQRREGQEPEQWDYERL
jgi:hypothetical protein